MNNLKTAVVLVGHGGLPKDISSELVEKFMRIHKTRIKTGSDITKQEFLNCSDGYWNIAPEKKRNGHPAPFPEELIYRLTKYYSFKENTVLDMFGGTGTVAYVAKKNQRNFIHIDISEEYCKIASDRLETLQCKG